ARAGETVEPIPTALDPVELLEARDDVVGVAKAHRDSPPQLIEPPGPLPLGQQGPDHPRRPGGEERLEGAADPPHVGASLLLNEDAVKGQVAVPGEVQVAAAIPMNQSR